MTSAEIRAWLRRGGPSVILVELDYMYQVGVAESAVPTLGTKYFSTGPYVDEDVPRKYEDCVLQAPTYTRSLDRSTLRGRYAVSVGDLVISNEDGAHDYLLGLAIDGSEVRTYVGDPTWAFTNFIQLPSAMALVASAPSRGTIRITLRDASVLLNKRIGGMAEIGGTDPSANKFRPINFGFVNQLLPIVYDHTISKYVHSDTGTNTAAVDVRNDGVSVTFTDNADGTFTLAVPPAGNEIITCDVLADADGTGYAYRATDLMEWLVGDRCGFTALGRYYGSLPAVTLPDTSPHLGLSIAEKTKVIDLLDQVTNSHNTFWAINQSGQFYYGRMRPEALSALVASGRAISAEIGVDDIFVAKFRLEHNAPTFTAYQAYGNVNWTEQSTFGSSLTEAERNKYTRKGFYTPNYVGEDPGTTSYLGPVSYLGGAPQLYHLTMSDSSLVETLISGPDDTSDIDPGQPGYTVESNLETWASIRRSQMLPWTEFIDFDAGLDLYTLELGQIVNVTLPWTGLDAGSLYQVCTIGINAGERKTQLGLVRRRYAGVLDDGAGSFELREDGDYEYREDGGYELREDSAPVSSPPTAIDYGTLVIELTFSDGATGGPTTNTGSVGGMFALGDGATGNFPTIQSTGGNPSGRLVFANVGGNSKAVATQTMSADYLIGAANFRIMVDAYFANASSTFGMSFWGWGASGQTENPFLTLGTDGHLYFGNDLGMSHDTGYVVPFDTTFRTYELRRAAGVAEVLVDSVVVYSVAYTATCNVGSAIDSFHVGTYQNGSGGVSGASFDNFRFYNGSV